MVLAHINKDLRELKVKKIEARPHSLWTIQNYMNSRDDVREGNKKRNIPVGIAETMKEKLGIYSLDFYIDGKSNLFLEESTNDGNRIIEFKNIDMIR